MDGQHATEDRVPFVRMTSGVMLYRREQLEVIALARTRVHVFMRTPQVLAGPGAPRL